VARESARGKAASGAGWIATILGIAVLVAGGFALGLVVGVVSEEPELVVGHLAGRSTEVDWAGDVSPSDSQSEQGAEPDVAAGPSFGRKTEADAGRGTSRAASALAGSASTAGHSRPEPYFAIQVGAFVDAESARSVATHLTDSGYLVHVLEPDTDDRWRVRVGPIEGRDEADRVAVRLKTEEQLPTWVLREQGS
jgi:cell division septation protein DedD